MSDLKRFQTLVDDVWKIVFGTERRQEPKRARTEKGYYKADDKSTEYTNEAWVGGKAPTRVKTVGYKKRKKNVKS